MTPTAAASTDRRSVSNGARLDQQVEAARAAGLTGASAPAVVGRYEVLLRIARGGMGTVYLARVTGEGGFRRLFALKVIRDHLSQNDDYVRMLLQEARIASRLHHPNVVGIVDIGTLANQHYLVMDYVEGCTFSELLKVHRRTRPPHLIVPLMLDALSGLHAAHSLVDDDGSPLVLVHCDSSPQNMLVGTNGICRITDSRHRQGRQRAS
ncbi:MAG: serine/threonine-protein kinase [Nannocystaceae bacterium]